MINDYLLLGPHRNVLAGRTVTQTAGTHDPEYPLSYLTDLRPAFPIRFPPGAWGVSVSVDTQDIQLVVLANHSLDAAVTVGGAAGTITPDIARKNGVRTNPFLFLTTPTAGVTALTFSGTNTGKTMVGEAFAGVPAEIPALQMADASNQYKDGSNGALLGDYMNIPQWDKKMAFRIFTGTQIFQTAQRDELLDTFDAQMTMRFPSVLILDRESNDARIVLLMEPTFKQGGHKDLWEATLTFLEFPRYRW
jgi:hypothetical protein